MWEANSIFPKKWGKKYMKREGNKLSIFKIEKNPISLMMRRDLDLGMGKNVKKWRKKYKERKGKSIRFNKLLYIIMTLNNKVL